MHDKEKVELGIKACWSEYFSHKCFDCPYVSDRNDRKCVERLGTDALALLKEQKWIPVTERLPEVRHAVLCYTPHHKNIWALSLHEDNEWYYWIPTNKKYNPDFEGDITHWMPLPEHPKEGR